MALTQITAPKIIEKRTLNSRESSEETAGPRWSIPTPFQFRYARIPKGIRKLSPEIMMVAKNPE